MIARELLQLLSKHCLSKHSLWALYQMDMWHNSSVFEKHDIEQSTVMPLWFCFSLLFFIFLERPFGSAFCHLAGSESISTLFQPNCLRLSLWFTLWLWESLGLSLACRNRFQHVIEGDRFQCIRWLRCPRPLPALSDTHPKTHTPSCSVHSWQSSQVAEPGLKIVTYDH